MRKKEFRILSIDGGGIRGLIPAIILTEIENRTKKRIANMFDMIAGTSTGGILALALTKPDDLGQPEYKARDMVEMYAGAEGKEIFKKPNPLDKVIPIGDIYSSAGIEDVLQKRFKNTMLKEALTNVLITSYDTMSRKATFFSKTDIKYDKAEKKYERNENTKYTHILMRDIARATSAAPTYFSPQQIEIDESFRPYIDGGVFANNPTMCAYAEVKNDPDVDDTRILIVSLGTGEMNFPYSFEDIEKWNQLHRLLEKAKHLLEFTMDGVSDTVQYQMKKLIPDQNYFRFQLKLDTSKESQMDNVEESNIEYLRNLTRTYIDNDWQDKLDELCKRLKSG